MVSNKSIEAKAIEVRDARFALYEGEDGVIIRVRTDVGIWKDVGHPYVYKDVEAAIADIKRHGAYWLETYNGQGRKLIGLYTIEGVEVA